jgi:membrane fusion protein, macrolide-specific efflux system
MKVIQRLRAVTSILMAALAVGMLVSGCSILPAEEEVLQPPLIEPEQIKYRTEAAIRGNLVDELNLTAKFSPQLTASLSFQKQSGRLKSLEITIGDDVKKGDVIAQLDTAQVELDMKLLQIDIEKTKLTLSQLNANGADAYSIKRARLDLEQQQLRLANYQDQIVQSKIVAPFDGRITYLLSASLGDFINAYQQVAVIADTSKLVVITSANDASELAIGAAVTVEFDGKPLPGEVVANPSTLYADPNQSLRFSAIVKLVNGVPDGARLSSPARIRYVRDSRENVIVLPRGSINSVGSRRYVNVLVDGIRVEKDVQVGLITDTQAEIISGIDEGDLVILN